MRTTLIFLVITFSTLTLKGNYNEPIVNTDKRIELLSVISRLAEFDEYKNNNFRTYSEKVDDHFLKFKNHEIVNYLKQLRKERVIAYDAIMSLAIRIEISDNSISLFDTETLDSRWDKNNLDKLATLLNDFYGLSEFESFYNSNKELYEVATRKLIEATSEINYKWFSDFYGLINQDKYIIVAGMLLGNNNYGGRTTHNDQNKKLYSILGVSHTTTDGLPFYSKQFIEDIAIHEFTHSFMNPLVDLHFLEMEDKAVEFYEISKRNFNRMAYGEPLIVFRESFVRAGVIEYYKQNRETELQINVRKESELGLGFYLVPTLVNYFDNYNQKRAQFKTFQDYMPVIVEKQNNLSAKELRREYRRQPKGKRCWVVETSINQNSVDVDPNTKELIVYFNTPLNLGSMGITRGKKDNTGFDMDREVKWNYDTGKVIVVPLLLKPNEEYSIKFFAFRTVRGRKMKKPFVLNFKTIEN